MTAHLLRVHLVRTYSMQANMVPVLISLFMLFTWLLPGPVFPTVPINSLPAIFRLGSGASDNPQPSLHFVAVGLAGASHRSPNQEYQLMAIDESPRPNPNDPQFDSFPGKVHKGPYGFSALTSVPVRPKAFGPPNR